MTDQRLFTPEASRLQAIEVRRVLLRLTNGDGEDRQLGADVLEAVEAPPTIGDVTGCFDCAWALAEELKQSTLNLHVRTGFEVRKRIDEGWKSADKVTNADIARAMTVIVLRTHLANLERAPA